jgi:hypothetical protein
LQPDAPQFQGSESSRLLVDNYGAVGDGTINDSAAFRAATAALVALGGGTLVLTAGRTYIVGQQDQSVPASFAFTPKDIINLGPFAGYIKIEGNGATMKAAAGLKYGSFNADGTVYSTINVDPTKIASPYLGMIHSEGFTGTLEVENIELDGNINHMTIGGQWGDTGWQIKNAGIQVPSAGKLILRNVYSHHHGTDGVTYYANMTDFDTVAIPLYAENCRFLYNGRLGFACTGGKGGHFVNCDFTRTGDNGLIDSNPHAGFDMEPEGGRICADFMFDQCRFQANKGAGYISDVTGASCRGVTFNDCEFSGDYNFSFWIVSNQHVFNGCRINGSTVDRAVDDFTEGGAGAATRYYQCTLLGDPKQAPAGVLQGQGVGHIGGHGSGTAQYLECTLDYSSNEIWPPPHSHLTVYWNCRFITSRDGTYFMGYNLYGTTIHNRIGGLGVLGIGNKYGPYYRDGVLVP